MRNESAESRVRARAHTQLDSSGSAMASPAPTLHVPSRRCGCGRRGALRLLVAATLVLVGIAIAGRALAGAAAATDFAQKNLAPSLAHPFGTDWMGRDMLCRTLAGLSTSVLVGVASAAVSSIVAIALAVASAFGGHRLDAAIEWLTDLVMGIPHLILLILISYALGRGTLGVLVGVSLTHWPSLSRVLRAEMLQVSAQPFMACSRALGVSRLRLAVTHLVPHVLPQYLIGLVLLFPHAVLHEASITFLGFGLSPEEPAIGVILSEALTYLTAGAWWLAVFPGLALLAVVLLFDMVCRTVSSAVLATSASTTSVSSVSAASAPAASTVSPFFDSFGAAAGGSVEKRRRSEGDAGMLREAAQEGVQEAAQEEGQPLLKVEHLSMSFSRYEPGAPFFQARQVNMPVLNDLSLSVRAGELIAVVGASGSGKTLLADAILGLFAPNARVEGSIRFAGRPLGATGIAGLRGRGVSLVPQSVTSLDPLMRVGEQVVGACGRGRVGRARRRERTARMRTLFRELGLDGSVERMFPHELSGGMARRVLVASALIDDPWLIVADEPTPGLDMELAVRALGDLRAFADAGGAVLLITHDLELALSVADRVAVFRDGCVVEEAPVSSFQRPELLCHPFSRALWHAMPEHEFAPSVPCEAASRDAERWELKRDTRTAGGGDSQ
ncbi:ATP-binding cassette domain-containing protein [uncultured Enorma sp.]|uniref:ATP-binding cassette domain-containing protein n=1 Tax=uncultured Enorma sp. TaxID=1714346 RepID=UPI002805C05C|nr:ATP-binding cassette domain-containing protein [uncultured Enorma sp.]